MENITIRVAQFENVGEIVTELYWDTTNFEVSPLATGIPFNQRIINSALLLFVSILGIAGNTLVIASVMLSKKLQTPTNVLVISLAIADLLTCIIIPFQTSMLLSRSNWQLPDIICKIVVYLSFVAICCSVMTLAAIAVIRWYVITRSVHGYHGINTFRSMILVAIIIWIASIVAMVTPPSLGIGSVGYSGFYRLCSVTDDNPLRAFYVLIQAILLILALVVTAVFYILILVYVVGSTKSFQSQFKEDGTSKEQQNKSSGKGGKGKSSASSFNKREIEITKNLFMVVCVFVACMCPQGVNFIIPGASIFTFYSGSIMALNSSLNPIIYGLKHPNFGEVFRCLLTCNLAGIPQPVIKVKSSTATRATTASAKNTNKGV